MSKYPRFGADISDLKTAARNYILPGFIPERPILKPSDSIFAFGSCFAENLSNVLQSRGQECFLFQIQEAFNSPAINELIFSDIVGIPARAGHTPFLTADAISLAQAKIKAASLIIFTLGVATYATAHGVVNYFSAENFVHPTVEQATTSITQLIGHLRSLNPAVEIVVTVSPVPLNRALWAESAVAADVVSKCTLRLAAQSVVDAGLARYWPSFEIVRWLGAHIPGAYGADDGHLRHVSNAFVNVIIELFLESYGLSVK